MKFNLYSTPWSGLGSSDRPLKAKEYSAYCERELKSHFKTKKSLLNWYLKMDAAKLPALDFLAKQIEKKGYTNILSLGAGSCVLEHLLKKRLPHLTIVATDYNLFYLKNGKRLFPELKFRKFDFFKDGVSDLKKTGVKFDVAVFFGSSYVMDDELFVKQFMGLGEIGIKEIVDFQAGYIQTGKIPYFFLLEAGRALLEKFGIPLNRGKFHGYCRSRGELRRLYERAGLELIDETTAGLYKYVAICKVKT